MDNGINSNFRERHAVSTITSANRIAVPQAMTSQTNQRHMTAVTQSIVITVVYVISFLSLSLNVNHVVANGFIYLPYYINHLSNFFIYLAVNKQFRNEAKIVGKTIGEQMRCAKQ